MIPRDKLILDRLTRTQRLLIVHFMVRAGLIDKESARKPREPVYAFLRHRHITMADIIYILDRQSQTRLDAHYLLRDMLDMLVPKAPQNILPHLPAYMQRTITGVFNEFIIVPTPAYRVGQTVADLVLIYGMDIDQIKREEAKGGLRLS